MRFHQCVKSPFVIYFLYNRNGWNNQTVVGSPLPFDIVVSNDTKEAYITNNNSDLLKIFCKKRKRTLLE